MPAAGDDRPSAGAPTPPQAPGDGGPDGPGTGLGDGVQTSVTKALGWSLLSAWGGRIMSMAIFLTLGRLLDAPDFGLVALAYLFVEFGSVAATSGFHRAIVQRDVLEPSHMDAAFWGSSTIGAIFSVAMFVAAPRLAEAFNEPEFTGIARVLCLIFLFNGIVAAPHALLHRRMAFRAFALRQFISVAVSGVVAVVVAAAGGGPWALVAQSITSSAINVPILWRAAGWWPRLRVSWRHFRQLIGFGLLSVAIDILYIGMIRSDDLIIGSVLGATALGFYTVAYKVFAILMELVLQSVNAVLFPVFSRLNSDPDRAREALLRTARYASTLGLPIFVGLATLAPDIILGIFGQKWQDSVPVMRVLAMTSTLVVATFYVRELTMAAGRAKTELARSLTEITLLVVAFLTVASNGIVWVAWARLAVVAFMAPIAFLIVRSLLGIPVRALLAQYVVPLVAAGAMSAAVLALRAALPWEAGSLVALAICVVAGAVIYVAVLAVLGREQLRDVAGPLLDRLRERRQRRSVRPG